MVKFDTSAECVLQLWEFILSYLIVLGLSLLSEFAICVVAMRGSILDTTPRASMQHLLYIRLGKFYYIGIVCLCSILFADLLAVSLEYLANIFICKNKLKIGRI